MSLREIFSKKKDRSNSSIDNISNNNQGNAEHKQEYSPFAGVRNYTLTWKDRYEIALRFGTLVKFEDEEIEVPDFVKVKIISEEEKNKMLADLSKNQEGQLMSHSKVADILNIEESLIKAGIRAGTIKDKYIQTLIIITLYLHNIIPNDKSDKDKIIIDTNEEIISIIGKGAETLDSQFIIGFIDVLSNIFGDIIICDEYKQLIGKMASSDNNRMLLDIVKKITEDFEFKKYSEIIRIIKTLQDNKIFPPEHEVSLDDYSNDERTCQRYNELKESNDLRNFDLSMLRDIISATDFKEKKPEDIENLISSLAQLNSKYLNDFWRNFSGMQASYETMINRTNKYLEDQNKKQRELKKPSIKERQRFCAAAIAGGAGILLLAGYLLNGKQLKSEKPIPTTYVSDHLDGNNSIKIVKGKLAANLPIGDGNGVLTKNTEVKIIPGENPNEFYLVTPDIVITPELLNDNELLYMIIEDLLNQGETKEQENAVIEKKIAELGEQENTVGETNPSEQQHSYIDE